ncbi:MAG: tyrosine-protein phosphatase [Pyrinomonadaceae bacterium]
MILKILRTHFAMMASILSVGAVAVAQITPIKNFADITIANFGQMDERYYRGAQPAPDEYASLKALGINTVVDLRNDPTDYERPAVEALGMKYVNIPMSGWKTPKMEDINAFLTLLDDPATGTVYVHCKAGRHRASVAGAAYRYTKYDWNYDQVYKEMKDFRYSSGLVHGALGSFVKKWGKRREAEREQNAKLAAAGAQLSN